MRYTAASGTGIIVDAGVIGGVTQFSTAINSASCLQSIVGAGPYPLAMFMAHWAQGIQTWDNALTNTAFTTWGTSDNACVGLKQSLHVWLPDSGEHLTDERAERLARDKKARGVKLRQDRIARRARRILADHLDEKQLAMLGHKGYFLVQTASGNIYRIKREPTRNVALLGPEGKPVRGFCCVSQGIQLPVEDQMLAQKVILEADEERFCKIANQWDIKQPPPDADAYIQAVLNAQTHNQPTTHVVAA